MATSTPAPAPTPAETTLEAQLDGRRTDAQRQQARALFYRDLLTSLWAPITILGIAFVPYLIVIGLWPGTGVAGQRVMQGLAGVLALYFVALLVHRLAFARERRLRALRHESAELTAEVAEIYRRGGEKLDPKLREQLLAQAAAVDAARLEGDPDRLADQTEKLGKLTEQKLAPLRKNSTFDLIWGLTKALLIALAIRAVLIEPFRIPSGSMIPTLLVGDQIFVNKFIYGVRIPWVNKVPFVIVRTPARGDVIVFENPLDPSKDFVKRVIGIPGDVVELRDQVVYLNGVAQPRTEVGPYVQYSRSEFDGGWSGMESILYQETLTGYSHPLLQLEPPPGRYPRQGPYTVPEGQVFVMGDNRDNSGDSRVGFSVPGHGNEVAYVPYGNIKGKAMVIWLSWSYQGWLSSWFGSGLRVDRLFMPVR